MTYFGSRGANNTTIFGVIAILVIIVVVYTMNSGALNLFGPSGLSANTFSVSSNLSSSSILQGYSGQLFFSFLNPYNESIDARINLTTVDSSFINIPDPSRAVLMPSAMKSSSSIVFNVSCIGSGQSSYALSAEIPNFWQNLTTSVVTYPYRTSSSQVPKEVYNNPNAGFLKVSAQPLLIETQTSTVPLQQSMNIVFSSTTFNGYQSGPYTAISLGSPNNYISEILVSIDNSSSGGIKSAFVYYNGNSYPLTQVSPGILGAELKDAYVPLIEPSIPIIITAVNSQTASQEIVNIAIKYNYYFSYTGPSEIVCQ